ncbi:hypothetical protein [Trichoplusia ni ascovirus 2c]|uniref:hypothetical protein n=1 Tax=Trichoplusia ni ascovirus 2c TaxID=328615 RepID=UPI0000E44252|nr:hypothetical protein TNAV2c_gp122 [Trichoplusia ni ascovirus 2c]ABF70639.1 hypothetical protein [Trichoplusia ni ascovirus 2c]AUS94230.1 hypothetical protein [Trichoplusia ni ascovirus 6b]
MSNRAINETASKQRHVTTNKTLKHNEVKKSSSSSSSSSSQGGNRSVKSVFSSPMPHLNLNTTNKSKQPPSPSCVKRKQKTKSITPPPPQSPLSTESSSSPSSVISSPSPKLHKRQYPRYEVISPTHSSSSSLYYDDDDDDDDGDYNDTIVLNDRLIHRKNYHSHRRDITSPDYSSEFPVSPARVSRLVQYGNDLISLNDFCLEFDIPYNLMIRFIPTKLQERVSTGIYIKAEVIRNIIMNHVSPTRYSLINNIFETIVNCYNNLSIVLENSFKYDGINNDIDICIPEIYLGISVISNTETDSKVKTVNMTSYELTEEGGGVLLDILTICCNNDNLFKAIGKIFKVINSKLYMLGKDNSASSPSYTNRKKYKKSSSSSSSSKSKLQHKR